MILISFGPVQKLWAHIPSTLFWICYVLCTIELYCFSSNKLASLFQLSFNIQYTIFSKQTICHCQGQVMMMMMKSFCPVQKILEHIPPTLFRICLLCLIYLPLNCTISAPLNSLVSSNFHLTSSIQFSQNRLFVTVKVKIEPPKDCS